MFGGIAVDWDVEFWASRYPLHYLAVYNREIRGSPEESLRALWRWKSLHRTSYTPEDVLPFLEVTSSPAVNGGASLPQRGTRSSGSVSRLALPASMGRVSTLGRERLVALSRALPSESVSSRSIFNRPLSPNRSNLAVLCRHGSHLVGQRPSTGLPARRKHGWSAAHIPRSFAMGCGVTLSKHTFADDLAVSVGVPAVPLAAVASRNGRDSRPP